MTLNCIDYKIAVALASADIPFSALLAAALIRADTENARKINQEWPMLARDCQSRYRFPGGVLPEESTDAEQVDDLSARAEEIARTYLSRVGVQV